ncbi:MAG TPA: ATP-binding cassette domain-containing protein, partial [Desulfobaccales bacterium]|nr:ATP-binding cassette domain-containing protein [Desulfobaccales bacterium]
MLQVQNLRVTYGPVTALDGISFAVPRGQIVTLLGANGSGKSTTLKAITGLTATQGGRIIFAGREIQGRPGHAIIRAGLALVPEGRRVFANLTVYENLL